ncbi:MAG TPA: hypothetical protein VNF99_09735 [Stellaceae bacterium]|nr:hypothetical protein [Stellaceae bacterium]
MDALKRGFWAALVLAAAVLLGPLVLWSKLTSADLPPKPAFPLPGQAFVAEYGGQAAYVAHLAYRWNLFGIGAGLRRADIILLGSSHTQFGLSARQMSADFSRAAGRPITVFNAGLGCDTPLSFDARLLDDRDIRDRDLVVDTFAYDFDPYTYACFSEFSEIADPVQGLFKALAVWSRFDWDWMLDGSVPRIDLAGRRPTVGRYLNQPATILDWNYGDVVSLFSPAGGEEFPSSGKGKGQDIANGPSPWRLASGTIPLPQRFEEIAGPRHNRPIFTLIPFVLSPGFNRDRYDNVVRLLAATSSRSRGRFVALPAEGLASFDGQHLTGAARAVATDRLAASLVASGFLSSILKQP